MVCLREIPRMAVFAWSPGVGTPLLVTGTRAGAVSDDFSSEVKLELWNLGLDSITHGDVEPAGSIATDSGFNDIAWSEPSNEHPLGVIAGALENGSVDLWDAKKLQEGSSDAFISRTSKHTGNAKALQWNPHRQNLLASVGANGEIFIYDLNNMANPFRLGATAARADDLECLDWNKQEKTAHILATGSSGGFVTVWDVKQKKDILTLNNKGRKAVSAVAWDPEESTKLATATPNDQEPLVFLWSLRNSSEPERTLKGHELGVLGLSWCIQDPELLLSCGKDNRTICWNPKTGERYSEFTAGSNWAFQTKWNPHNPNLVAIASFDGKILITSIQSTNAKSEEEFAANQTLDSEDFFAKAQSQPQGIQFSLPRAPRWAARPASTSFGFGGKLVRVSSDASRKSKITIEPYAVEQSIGEAAQGIEAKLSSGDLASICTSKIDNAKTDEEKADWQVIETLNTGKSRKQLRKYLGFSDSTDEDLAKQTENLSVQAETPAATETNQTDDDFFGSGEEEDNFLADLAATKGAKTNNPFHIYTGSEPDADKSITRALMLGDFDAALDICLKEDRMSDAFMIAVCGGQKCTDKAQAAYLKKKSNGPNYLRLLASIVGRNLWDVVHNADISNWKEVMATLCTYADEQEFPDLCEALGDRLEEVYQTGEGPKTLRRDSSFCYLAGAKLEKVVNNWVEELQEQEKVTLEQSEGQNHFSIHAKCLQDFIEKVSVFRKVTSFHDGEIQSTAGWKLAPLYSLYAEYAEILCAHGELNSAAKYLDLLPPNFMGAESAQQRIKQATSKTGVVAAQARTATTQRAPARVASTVQSFQPMQPTQPLRPSASLPYAPPAATAPALNATHPYAPSASMYAPVGYQPPQTEGPYSQPGPYGGYQPPPQQAQITGPPRTGTASPSGPPPSAVKSTANWNDMPENFLKERAPSSRRGTPGIHPVAAPFPNGAPAPISTLPPTGPPSQSHMQKPMPPLPPPPRAGEGPPRLTSPPAAGLPQSLQRVPSTTAAAYAPPVSSRPPGTTLPPPSGPAPVSRGASPYQPPPSTSTAAPSNRYAPAPGSQPSLGQGAVPPQRNVAPNPYQLQQQSPYAPQQPPRQAPYGQTPPPQATSHRAGLPPSGPPPPGPPRGSLAPPQNSPGLGGPSPVQQLAQQGGELQASTVAAPPSAPAVKPKHPRGDRSHIPAHAQPILDLLLPEMVRIKSVAPQAFIPQVEDMDKRINILFDHLNNEELLGLDTIQQMVEISQLIQRKEWDLALSLFTEMQSAKLEKEGTHWMVGVKRLIAIGRATKN